MTASYTPVRRLLVKLATTRHLTIPGDTTRMARSIAAFDAIDQSFSATAERLLDSGDSTIEKILVLWLDSSHRINNAISEADDIRDLSGLDYNAARFVLEDAILHSSVDRLNVPATAASAREGHWFMLASTASPCTTLLTDSTDDVDRYCHPLAVASHLLNVKDQERRQQFVDEAPAFIAWAAGQADLKATLRAALRTGSTNPATITSFMELHKEAPIPLHSGLL
jgi:hypothetical protein